MDSINSWVDLEEVEKIANSLLKEVPEAKDWEAESFEGFAVSGDEVSAADLKSKPQVEGNMVRESAERSLAKASEMAQRAGLLQKEEKVEEEVVVLNVEEERDRLHESQVSAKGALGDIDDVVRSSSGATGICVVDRDGDVLHDSMRNQAWTRYTVLAADMAELSDGGSVFQKVSGSNYLQLVPAKTSRGGVLMGMLVPTPISSGEALELGIQVGKIANR